MTGCKGIGFFTFPDSLKYLMKRQKLEDQSLHNVNEVSATLVRTPGKPGDLTSILQHIAQTAQKYFATDACVVLAFNPITGSYIGSQAVVGDSHTKSELLHDMPRKDGVTQRVLGKNDGVIVIEDLDAEPQYHNRFTLRGGFRAFAGLAMRTRHRQRPLGVIHLSYRQTREFTSTDYESFRIFAVQASFLLQETWLAHHFEQVARIGQEVNHDLATVDELFQKLQTYVDAVLDDSHILMLAILQAQTNTLEIRIRGQECNYFVNKPLEGACEYVIRTQESCFIKQWSKEKEQLPFQIINLTGTEENESQIFVPLTLRDVSLGVLSIQHRLKETYGREDLFVLQLLANYISLALHNMRLYSNLSRLNETGQLLTRQLESEQTLQAIVDKIRDATQADIVVLYPYEPDHQRFILPPRRSGTLLDSPIQKLSPSQPDDIAGLMLRRGEPIFANESTTLYHRLLGEGQARQGKFAQREKLRSTAVVPLQVGDQSVGVLFVNFRQTQYFDAPQKKLIDGLAHYAAIAIKNSRAFGTLSQRRMRELEILQHIDLELNRTLDLEAVLSTLLKLANEHVHAEEASILLRNPRIKALEIPAAIGLHAEDRRTHIISLQEPKGITRWVFEHKKPARVTNVLCDAQWRHIYIPSEAKTISELDIPLLDGEEVVGVLNFESSKESAFRQEDEDFLMTLAGQAVLAIKNAQAYEREKRLAEEGQILNEISKEITSQFDHMRVFDLILKKTLELTRSTLGSLLLYDPQLNDLWVAAERGLGEDKRNIHIALDRGIVGNVATHKRFLNVDVTQPPWNTVYLALFSGTRSELAVPMLAGDELRGVLNVESTSPNHFSESDERLLKGLADLAVVALQNAESYKQVEMEAQRFKLMYQAEQELSKITDLEQLEQAYKVIVQIANQQSQSQVVIYRYDAVNGEMVLKCASPARHARLFQRIQLHEGLTGQVARERRTIVVHDADNLPPGIAPVKKSDPSMHSLVVTPIMFKDRYYGNLGLRHREVWHFRDADIEFYTGLAQQLASTIYRLETVEARKESEQRAKDSEAMSEIGQMAFELTHRWDNDLGLVRSYVNDIQQELEELEIHNTFITKKLDNIVQSARTVLDLSRELKQELVKSGEAVAGEPAFTPSIEDTGAPVVIQPRVLLEEARQIVSLPAHIEIDQEIEEDVFSVLVIHNLVVDILRNLISNAIDAMSGGGKITLKAHNAGRSVALEVTDTGFGISQQHLSKIFDLFYSTKGSSGFGLWSARRNALRNHGNLTVKSEPGKGTTFTLLLPRVEDISIEDFKE